MDSSLKQRLVGATVLVALAVIFLPMLVKGPAPDSGVSDVSLDIPPEPKGDASTATIDLPLTPSAALPQGGVVGMPADSRDDETAASTTGVFPAVAAGDYVVSFGSYATSADADQVVAALISAELPAYREAARINGRDAQRVRIGPFADRAVAESARLRAAHVNDKVDAKVVVLDADTAAPAKVAAAPAATPTKPEPLPAVIKPATPPAATVAKPAATTTPPATPALVAAPPAAPVAKPAADTSKTGFAVQVGAFSVNADATALRDKLRGAGFNAFTDTVTTDKGVLTRVRVGPAMNRAEADALKVSVQAKLGLNGMVRPHP